jgi:hypothetical protein
VPGLTRLALLLLLHLLGAHLQHTNHARSILALGLDNNNLAGLQVFGPILFLVLWVSVGTRQPAAGRRQAGRHERGAGQDEADGAAVDAQSVERRGVLVHEGQVRQEGVVHVLEKERRAVERV